MPLLTVAGATLSYKVTGNGPLLLLIPGAGGTGLAFMGIAKNLAKYYRVVRYNRRGFSGSPVTSSSSSPQENSSRLVTDADDAALLIEHLSNVPAAVLGESSGAMVALRLVTRHPHCVDVVLLFEPPAMSLLSDAVHWDDVFQKIYDTYCNSGIRPALKLFRERTFAEVDHKTKRRGGRLQLIVPSIRANFAHWLSMNFDSTLLQTSISLRLRPSETRSFQRSDGHQADIPATRRLCNSPICLISRLSSSLAVIWLMSPTG